MRRTLVYVSFVCFELWPLFSLLPTFLFPLSRANDGTAEGKERKGRTKAPILLFCFVSGWSPSADTSQRVVALGTVLYEYACTTYG